ncbi:MAG: hypothetical protein JRH12_27340 [Deltaproteobacteria bacterium]|jgi:hypothetical protein|nr:hypothetical protein [Deltaproteobacteria bacterium]
MTKIVDLHNYRLRVMEKRGFGPWQKRFSESYDSRTRPSDLSDKTLYYLSQPGENSSNAYYELIMGILDLGQAAGFHYLDNRDQMRVVDIHLFLADQLRFEMMRRLNWLMSFPGSKYSLLEMVTEFDAIKLNCRQNPPDLARSNPNYSEYTRLTDGDKEVFIRRLLQEALDQFKERI